MMCRLPELVIFGPQRSLPDQENLSRLRLVILSEPKIVAAIEDLPSLWCAIRLTLPGLRQVPGPRAFQQLKAWIDYGRPLTLSQPCPNVLLTPLSVIADIANYLHTLRVYNTDKAKSHAAIFQNVRNHGGFQGFCTGLLAAIAIACSKEESDIGDHSAVALRLAVCVGAIVDLEGAFAVPPNEACCLGVRSRSGEEPTLLKILQDFPEAYVSVRTGKTYRTITTSKAAAPMLMQQLSSSMFHVKVIQTEGRFHTSRHENALTSLLEVCKNFPGLQYLPLDDDVALAYISLDSDLSATNKLHEIALRSILTEQADWHSSIARATARFDPEETADVLVIDKANSLNSAMLKDINARLKISYLHDFIFHECPYSNEAPLKHPQLRLGFTDASVQRTGSENDIAIIGMACRFPGAMCVEDYWQLLCEGKSMHREVPRARFPLESLNRTEGSQNIFWGNFLEDVEEFDHHFFKLSSREAISMDPQQRIALQVAYEAVESSGYFDELAKSKSVGCYIGVGSVDYEDNVASHPPTAFSALGTLRAFISGKISHWFGWTGPSITYDTACSSSAVAIHSACKAIQSGECTTALAGGVNIITSPMLYQNLSKARFLSPSGPCKPFDAEADGYCRGEGAGMVVLKRLSSAIADGDSITGVIAGSAISQSANYSPITVPHSESQSDLYRKVACMAGIDPSEVGYVEAHGTGTPVGDPIECESIRQVFGAVQRREILYFGSVKSNIGHTEAASGVAAVIKAVLMIQRGKVPVQANFKYLNPKISPLGPNKMTISTTTRPWNGTAICVNNYGAAGSNAAMIICKAPESQAPTKLTTSSRKYPLTISAHSKSSLRAYCVALRNFLTTKESASDGPGDPADIAFELAHRTNQTLSNSIATSVSSMAELQGILSEQGKFKNIQTLQDSPKRSTVLCFGGQTKAWIGLSEEIYQSVLILRMHLDRCEYICRSLAVEGFYPKIFSKTPIEDIVLLHCMLFSLQYSCAKSWIDCGLHVDVLIGHSFGQLTALCVSGSISLQQAMQLISGRARLIKNLWGPKRGAMLSIECDYKTVHRVLSLENQHGAHSVEVACFNGPTTRILVGSETSIEALECKLVRRIASLGHVKVRRLDVTHGFHSHLVDPILPGLADLTRAVDFHEPQIRIETCSKDCSWTQIDADAVTMHSREPVYFSEAVNRIVDAKGSCNWIEAGTDSGITTMACRALDGSVQARHYFQPISLSAENSMDALADATVSLWQSGVRVQFWPYHRLQRHEYRTISLPPYQFDKHRHWLEYREFTSAQPPENQLRSRTRSLLSFISFVRPQNSTQSLAEFMIDPESQEFKTYVEGHKVLGNASCPASVYIHLAARVFAELIEKEDVKMTEGDFCIEQLEMQSPLGLNSQRMISLSLESSDHTPGTWSFRICSRASAVDLKVAKHASGVAYLRAAESPANVRGEAHPERLHLSDGQGTSIEGTFIYNVFSKVVEYAEYFRGMQKVSSSETEITGIVSLEMASSVPTRIYDHLMCDPLMIDNFLQVAGLYINCLQRNTPGTVCVCTQIQEFHYSLDSKEQQLGPWRVVCNVVSVDEKALTYNITAYDAQNQRMVVKISGANFTRVSAVGLTKTLSNLRSIKFPPSSSDADYVDEGDKGMSTAHSRDVDHVTDLAPSDHSGRFGKLAEQSDPKKPVFQVSGSKIPVGDQQCFTQLVELLSSVTDVPIHDMHRNSLLGEIGVDSLMTTEVLGEIEKGFDISITMSEFERLDTLGCLCSHIERKDPRRFHTVVAPPEPVIKSNVMTSLQGSDPLKIFDKDKTAYNDTIDLYSNEKATTIGELKSTSSNSKGQGPEILASFDAAREALFSIADETQLTGFTEKVYPRQAELVVAYVVEAFGSLGCSISQLEEGNSVSVPVVPQHTALIKQLHQVLEKADLVHCHESGSVRSAAPVIETPAHDILQRLQDEFPQHLLEHRLLGEMGPQLANFLSGKADPVQLLFGNKSTKELLTDVYTKAPMSQTGTRLLARFLSKSIANMSLTKPIRILEIGGGVGGTTAPIIEVLEISCQPFIYTFTDISSSLVAAAKKRFSGHDSMRFKVLDIEAPPQDSLLRSQDIILATNVIHATKVLKESCSNIHKMLDKSGMLCLVELTRNLHWFDLVFGLLDGWWRFEDGRTHAIADVECWERNLVQAGFEHIVWTGDASEEGDLVRLIVTSTPSRELETETRADQDAQATMETILFKHVDRIPLYADIYYPKEMQKTKTRRPIALLIHGGGHIMLSRKDIRPIQLQHLLASGLLPISVDHRLCPELSLKSGPMTDICYALDWARNTLPALPLQRSDIAADGTKVVAIGWSTGGMLAMSLAWTAPARGLKPPEAILAFYCPTDYESEWWKKPHFPWRTSRADAERQYDLWDAVRETPITGYNIASARAPGGWMSTLDARARVPLHMNWTAQTLPVLLGALTSEKKAQRIASSHEKSSHHRPHDGHSSLPLPLAADVRAISPLAQIRAGNYHSPTYLVHGSEDDFIPWQESQRTYEELLRRGVEAGVSVVEGGGHMFEMLGVPRDDERVWQAVLDGYRFLFERVGIV